METILDDATTWILHAIVYRDELRIVLAEGFVADHTEQLCVGDRVVDELRPIEVTDRSRMLAVRFPQVIAWQTVDESYTRFDEYEQCDDRRTLQILSRSKYFDYVKGSHGWWEDVLGPSRHYRVWTEDEVIDVIACEPPVVEPWES